MIEKLNEELRILRLENKVKSQKDISTVALEEQNQQLSMHVRKLEDENFTMTEKVKQLAAELQEAKLTQANAAADAKLKD